MTVVAAPAEESVQPEDDPSPVSDSRRWLVLAVLCLALLVTGIDGTIVNVALPSLVRQLHTTASQLQWVVDGYTIVFASFLLIAGNTGDRLGRKACFIGGMLVFGAGSTACALVNDPNLLILTRALQGFGAAFIMPSTLSILANVFTDDYERRRAISIWAGVSGLGVAIGPLAGGLLLAHFWWGSVFFVNVPIIAVAIVGAVAVVPDSRDPNAPRLDVLGAVLSTIGLVALLYGIIEGPSDGWGSAGVAGAFAAAVVLLTAFVLWEQRCDHPILEIRFFKNPRFTAASVAVTLVFFAMFGCLFFISQYLQFVLGLSPLECGVRLIPVAAVLMVTAPVSAKFVARYGTKLVVGSGLLVVTIALVIFSRATVSSGYGLVALVLIVIGAGMGFAMAPATDSIMASLPPDKAGVGSAMNDTTRQIGGALGVGILGSITTSLYASRFVTEPGYAQLVAASARAADAARSSIGGAAIVASQLPASLATSLTSIADNAFVHALDGTVLVAAAVSLLGALVAFVFLPARAESDALSELIEGAAQHLDPVDRQGLAIATLATLADAGMASLTYSGIAARSGIGVATLQRHWTSRIDAVTDAVREVVDQHPIPDTGDLRRDLDAFITTLAEVLQDPYKKRVLGVLIAEAATSPELATAFRERVIGPRRAQLIERLQHEPTTLRVPAEAAVDMLIGPIYHRVMFLDAPVDRAFLDADLAGVLADASAPSRGIG